MSLAEQDERNGWKLQETGFGGGIGAPDRATPASPIGLPPPNRRNAFRLVGNERADTLAHAIETSLARELGLLSAETAQQKPPDSIDAAASHSSSLHVAVSAAPLAANMQPAVGATLVEKRADRLAQETALLSQKLAEAEKASADMPAAERDSGSRAGLDAKLKSVMAENADLSRAAAERDRAIAAAHIRVEYLEAALAAAEAECGRLQGEAAERDREQTETAALTVRFDAMSSRATMAERLLAETRERLIAHIIEIHDAQQRIARADAASSEASDRQRQLEEALSSQFSRFEELERSQSALADASADLLQRFHQRDRALAAAEETIKALAERNARFETAARHPVVANPRQAERPQAEVRADSDWGNSRAF